MAATNETPAQSETPDAPARYWPGYDTLLDEIARVNAQLAERDGKNYRDSWWRYNTRNKVLGPLKNAERFRRDGTHALILNRRPHGGETEEHHCSCGLIVDMPALPVLASTQKLDRRDAAFLVAPGHLDWRMQDPGNYATPEPDPERRPAVATNHRKSYWELGMHIAFYGPPQAHKLIRQRGDHLPIRTDWPANFDMPFRSCSCGLKVDAPDLLALSDDYFAKHSPTTYWPNDPAERERIQHAFFEAKGHKRLPVQKPESECDSE